MILCTGLLGLLALDEMARLSSLTGDLYRHPFAVSVAALEANAGIIAMHRSMKDVALAPDEAGIDAAAKAVNDGEAKVYDSLALVQERFMGDKSRIDGAIKAVRDWKPIRDEVIAGMKAGKRAEAAEITRTRGAVQVKLISEEMARLVTFSKQKAADFDADARATLQSAKVDVYGVLDGLTVLALVIGLVITRSVTVPLRRLGGIMDRLASQDHGAEVPYADRTNEIGRMARSVEVFKRNGIQVERLRAEQDENKARADEERRKAMHDLADDFEGHIEAVVEHVASASTEMTTTAASMSAASEQATRQATAAASAADMASGNVQTVASAAEELASSIGEIGRQVAAANAVTGHAVEQARHTTTIVGGLAQAASRIGDVVKLISDIASQTNLLALNATIEAARAGEHGKGFAVVASEVKQLANQTSKATDEIAQQIQAVQGATGEAVGAIEDILKTIGEVSHTTTAIATAVEQQQAATTEIARNIDEAATGTHAVAENIAGVNEAAIEAGKAATQVLRESGELSRQSEDLNHRVGTFLAKVRA